MQAQAISKPYVMSQHFSTSRPENNPPYITPATFYRMAEALEQFGNVVMAAGTVSKNDAILSAEGFFGKTLFNGHYDQQSEAKKEFAKCFLIHFVELAIGKSPDKTICFYKHNHIEFLLQRVDGEIHFIENNHNLIHPGKKLFGCDAVKFSEALFRMLNDISLDKSDHNLCSFICNNPVLLNSELGSEVKKSPPSRQTRLENNRHNRKIWNAEYAAIAIEKPDFPVQWSCLIPSDDLSVFLKNGRLPDTNAEKMLVFWEISTHLSIKEINAISKETKNLSPMAKCFHFIIKDITDLDFSSVPFLTEGICIKKLEALCEFVSARFEGNSITLWRSNSNDAGEPTNSLHNQSFGELIEVEERLNKQNLEILIDIIANNPNITSVNITGYYEFDSNALTNITNAIIKNSGITTLNISNCEVITHVDLQSTLGKLKNYPVPITLIAKKIELPLEQQDSVKISFKPYFPRKKPAFQFDWTVNEKVIDVFPALLAPHLISQRREHAMLILNSGLGNMPRDVAKLIVEFFFKI